MHVDGWKIKKLIEDYGRTKGYAEKSYVAKFSEDFKLNYNQWNAYTRGAQNIGTKVIQFLMDVFPDLDLNWLLKKEAEQYPESQQMEILEEPRTNTITPEIIYKKLQEMHKEIRKLTAKT